MKDKDATNHFNYENEIRGNPLRYKDLKSIISIVEGNIKTSRYYMGYGWGKDAKIELDEARVRIRIFEEDLIETGISLNGQADSLYALVNDAERVAFGGKKEN